MQEAQRTRANPALEFAVRRANDAGLPLAVVFCVVADYPDASARHMHFMFEGLRDVAGALDRRGIHFEALVGDPAEIVSELAEQAALLVFDRTYLPVSQRWRDDVIEHGDTPIVEVETEVVVPVDVVSDHAETAARTIRPKIEKCLDDFLVELRPTPLDDPESFDLARRASAERLSLDDPAAAVRELAIADEPAPVAGWRGGQNRAHALLDDFVSVTLGRYDDLRNRYTDDASSSKLSPYLHYGQISPVTIALAARNTDAPATHVDSFIDEVVVRRELAVNFVLHNHDHDAFAGLPDWARATLDEHADDARQATFTAAELEQAETKDPIWNAIMRRIRDSGWVHNQLRMYWGKQILYYTNTPGHAFRTLLKLNNRYFLDGRDPNSYANVGWCFGLHDQGFEERDVIGKVRPFTDAALKRKDDLAGWLGANRAPDDTDGSEHDAQ